MEIGTNVPAGTSRDGILNAYIESLEKVKLAPVPPLWDGKASERIREVVAGMRGSGEAERSGGQRSEVRSC